MEETCMELATIERMLKERDHIDDLLYLINHGDIERVKELLERDKETINQSLDSK